MYTWLFLLLAASRNLSLNIFQKRLSDAVSLHYVNVSVLMLFSLKTSVFISSTIKSP